MNSLAFGTGGVLAGASSDGRTWIWDATTGRLDGTLPHPAPVTAAAFRPGGTLLATAATDGVLRLWTVPGPVLPGARDSVFSVTFGRGGGELAIGSADDSVQLWDLDDPARPVRLGRAAGGPATGASAVSRDGRQLAIGGEDGTVRLWDLRDPRRPVLRPAPLTGLAATVESVAFSPDGRLLAASSDDHTVRLWDVSDPAAARPHGPVLRGGNYLYSVVFAGRDDLVAAAGADGTVRLWDLAADPPVATTVTASDTYEFAVAVSPDGRTLAAAGGDNAVRLWDLADPHHPRRVGPTLTGPSNYVNALDFGPGNRLAAGSGDGTVWLWDVADAARPVLRATLTGPVGAVFAVGFRPAGDLLAASGADRTVRLWSTDPAGAARRVCAVAGDPITRDEWARYVPGMDYTPPCHRPG